MKTSVFSIILVLALAGLSFSQVKKTEPVAVQVPFAKSQQIVVVTTKGWDAVTGLGTPNVANLIPDLIAATQ